MTPPTCVWFMRWSHRLRRLRDVEVRWPAIVARAEGMDEARLAWDVFLAQRGQDHWHCACGAPIRELFRTLTVRVAP